jgi:hypothetical protein
MKDNPNPKHRRNPTYLVLKSVLDQLDPKRPKSCLMIKQEVRYHEETVRYALFCLCDMGLAKAVKPPRSTWIEHSLPRYAWIKVSTSITSQQEPIL